MRVRLKQLVAHCEDERRTLTAAIDECVAEGDYGTAHRLTKGLWRVRRKLQMLHILQDPVHGEKEMAISHIQHLEELCATESGRMLDYYRNWIATEKQKLASLEAHIPDKNAPPATALHLALTKLLEARISTFTLVLSEPERLQFTFRRLRKTLLIMLSEVRRHRAAYTLQKRHLRFLLALGFRLYDQHDKLLLFLPFDETAAINAVKTTLARIVFDCFFFEELKGKSSIKYYEPEP